jgi:uracil-DNA glycosylase
MFDSVHDDWLPLFNAQHVLLTEITTRLKQPFVPGPNQVFRAFERSPSDYRVLILGQDPYPNPSHAVGLSFAVPPGTKPLPPSLQNIFKELSDDVGVENPSDIASWQQQGVMLLNRHLTTQPFATGAHFNLGWDRFTTEAARYLYQIRGEKLVAILWGSKAQEIAPLIPNAKIIRSPHPSPLSSYRGFFGSKPFSKTNAALIELGEQPIDWRC